MSRAIEIAGFLAQNGWDGAEQFPFGADFSSRRYARLVHPDGRRAVFMDADPNQKTPEFVDIDGFLRAMDIAAPEIFAADAENGLVLMEDFGGRNLGNLLDAGADAKTLYRRAADVLIHLHKNFDRAAARALDLQIFGGALFGSQVEMFLDYWLPHAKGREATREEGESFRAAWKDALKGIESLPQTLMLRDFMPDNLMDLPGRGGASPEQGVCSVGVLDFQDGGLGPIAYDLMSLCETVRRDGGDGMLNDMIAYYHDRAKPALSIAELTTACRILSAQRHMRVLGVIAKLAQNGRPEKLAYAPRIRAYLNQLFQDEMLKPVRDWSDKLKL